MKKVLLGTTALVASGLLAAPAMAADPIKINVGGYMQMFFAAGKTDSHSIHATTYAPSTGLFTTGDSTGTVNFRTPEIRYEGELWFIGQTKLDNGTTVGIRIELEGWTQAAGGDNLDEEYIFAFGDWGRIEFGATDSAAYKTVYAAPSALPGFSVAQHNSFVFSNGANTANHNGYAAALDSGLHSDTNRITYYTPRFAGLQLGISYTPYLSPTAAAGACGYSQGAGAGTGAGPCKANDDAWVNGVSIGGNYVNKFGDFGIAIYGAFSYAAFDRSFTATSTWNAIGADWLQFGGGLNLSYGGLTLGGSFGWDNNGMIAGNETMFWTAGVMYATGPWAASFTYFGGTRNETAPNVGATITAATGALIATAMHGTNGAFGQDTTHYFQVAASYNLGPGVKVFAGGILASNNGQTVAEQSSLWQVILGTEVRF